ncbi:hypothetical protein BH23ACT4_BH23ACT4_00690 [soil metagenome]
MKHEEIQDLLEDYVDDRLDRPTRKLVDDHLKECTECREILDEVAPVNVSALGGFTYDERAMRRTVRRSVFRTAWNTVLLLLTGLIVGWFLAALVVQPLAVNRGGRAADTARASIDLGIMLNPGAVLTDGSISSGWFDRHIDLEFGVPVGASVQPAISTSTRVGLFGIYDHFRAGQQSDVFRYGGFNGDAEDQLMNLGASTVATVAVWFDVPGSVERAQALADDPTLDFRVIWAGFDASLGRVEPPGWTAGGTLGYGTCQPPLDHLGDDLLGSTSAGFNQGTGFLYGNSAIATALDSVTAALTNISGQDALLDYLLPAPGDNPSDVDEILADLESDPEVSMVVVTGPSTAIAEYLQSEPGVSANVIAIDFYNWTDGICGR